jgi:hypothetical protein
MRYVGEVVERGMLLLLPPIDLLLVALPQQAAPLVLPFMQVGKVVCNQSKISCLLVDGRTATCSCGSRCVGFATWAVYMWEVVKHRAGAAVAALAVAAIAGGAATAGCTTGVVFHIYLSSGRLVCMYMSDAQFSVDNL